MELKHYLTTLWRWSWLIVLATALAAGMAYRSASRVPRVYQATTTLLVGHTLQTTNPNPGDIETSQTLAQGYVQLVKSQPILQAALDSLHLNLPWYDLSPEVNATVLSGTETITIAVVDESPQFAKTVADELARQLILQSPTPKEDDPQRQFANQQMQQLQGQIKSTQAQIVDLQKKADQETSAQALQDERNQINVLQQHVDGWQATYAKLSDFYQGSHTNYLSVIQPAVLPTSPVGTSTRYNVALAGGIGLALALAGVVLVEFLDDTIKSDRDLAPIINGPILGGMAWAKGVRQPTDQLIARNAPTSSGAEAYRFLGVNVRASGGSGGKVLLVTSPGPAEGKSTLAANLAITLAHLGQRVVLVDANLRRPSIHRLFELPNREGLSTLLSCEGGEPDALLHPTAVPNLRVLPSGPLPLNSGDLVGSPLMRDCLEQLRRGAEVVIVDSPAILGVADAGILGTICDQVLLVVRARRTRAPLAKQAVESLSQLGVSLHGAILNGYELGRRAYQSYYAVAADVPAAPVVPQCPLLGLRLDPSSVLLAPSSEHRCQATTPAGKVDLDHQRGFCLASSFGACPRFAASQSTSLAHSVDRVRPPSARQLGES